MSNFEPLEVCRAKVEVTLLLDKETQYSCSYEYLAGLSDKIVDMLTKYGVEIPENFGDL